MPQLSRRHLIQSLSASASWSWWNSGLVTLPVFSSQSLAADARKNLFLCFNNLRDQERGETDEFTTLRHISGLLNELGVAAGTKLGFVGLRSGTAADSTASPGELAGLSTAADEISVFCTRPENASPTPVGLDDPIVSTPMAVLYDETAHHFNLAPEQFAGSVLWSFYRDDTVRNIAGIRRGFHNAFSDVDSGLVEALFDSTVAARQNNNNWATPGLRQRLCQFLPRLRHDPSWNTFTRSLGQSVMDTVIRPYIRAQGWPGAAIVLRGPMTDVVPFHITEWNRKSPNDPDFVIGTGTHTWLRIRYGREFKPYCDGDATKWTMVGFVWADEATLGKWGQPADVFGQDFHIHGWRDDGRHGGHILFATQEAGPVSVSLYPLTFEEDNTAFLFNNDLAIDESTLVRADNGLHVDIYNNGQNFVRSVTVGLFSQRSMREQTVLTNLRPHERRPVHFTSDMARSHAASRSLRVDSGNALFENPSGETNNDFVVPPV